jgi:hypothetical protein
MCGHTGKSATGRPFARGSRQQDVQIQRAPVVLQQRAAPRPDLRFGSKARWVCLGRLPPRCRCGLVSKLTVHVPGGHAPSGDIFGSRSDAHDSSGFSWRQPTEIQTDTRPLPPYAAPAWALKRCSDMRPVGSSSRLLENIHCKCVAVAMVGPDAWAPACPRRAPGPKMAHCARTSSAADSHLLVVRAVAEYTDSLFVWACLTPEAPRYA